MFYSLRYPLPICLALLVGLLSVCKGQNKNLMPNGDFEGVSGGWFKDWQKRPGHSMGQDGNNHWLVLDGRYVQQQHTIKVPDGCKQLKISCRMQLTNVKKGGESYQDARLVMQFIDDKGKMAGKWPNVFHGDGTKSWQTYERVYDVPVGASFLKIGPANFGSSGKLEIDDIVITPLGVAEAVKEQETKAPVATCPKQPLGANLLPNADFSQDANKDGWPDTWPRRGNVSFRKEGDKHILVITGPTSLQRPVPIHPDYSELTVSCRMRLKDVVPGEQTWQEARVAMEFRDSADKHVDPWPNTISGKGTTEWIDYKRSYLVPKGAAKLIIGPSLFGKSGTVEVTDLKVLLAKYRATKQDLARPKGVNADPALTKAWKESSATRESICLNGLWQFLPVIAGEAGSLPMKGEGWGWFKVPGVWPTGKELSQEWLLPDYLRERIKPKEVVQAWYQREIQIPKVWNGRTISIDFTMLQTHAEVFVDGKDAGGIFFPGGKVDITKFAKPGKRQKIALLVTAKPLAKGTETFMAAGRIFKNKASVVQRGITGDLYLRSRAKNAYLDDLRIQTSTRKNEIKVLAKVDGNADGDYVLAAKVLDHGKEVKSFKSATFKKSQLTDGIAVAQDKWIDAKLWDLNTPGNQYELVLSLMTPAGKIVDEMLPQTFGFREFWIDGRDFYLNGKRVHLRALTTGNINGGADLANYAACTATCKRLEEYGFNFLITGNYNFRPGAVSYMEGLFKAADDTGVLASMSIPHASDFDWRLDDPEVAENYRKLCRYLVRFAQNHPSIVLYTSCHNATGHKGDQNPMHIDGLFNPEDPQYGGGKNKHRAQALITAKIAKELDPTRGVYHHSSGNLGDMHTNNIYLNWAPVQERDDWLEHWGTKGVKPVFFVEWGLPHVASFSSYRGPSFIWRTEAIQSVWGAEFAVPYMGEKAYEYTPERVKALEHEETLLKRLKPIHYGWLSAVFRSNEKNYIEVQSYFADRNWRAHRTWGASAMLPWDQKSLWGYKGKGGTKTNPKRFANLEQPGIVSDVLPEAGSYVDYINAPDPANYYPSSLGKVFQRWNQPVIAYIGGKAGHFTEKGHNFVAGEEIKKQVIVVNDSRQKQVGKYSCTFTATGKVLEGEITVPVGDTVKVPLVFKAGDVKPGHYLLKATFELNGKTQADSLEIDVVGKPATVSLSGKVGLYDPKGLTAKLLKGLGVDFTPIADGGATSSFDVLIIGREALANDAPLPNMSGLKQGQRIIVMEQQTPVLSDRLGFRVQERGVRKVFDSAPGSSIFAGLTSRNLHDWRGAASLLSPHVEGAEMSDPQWKWCGFINTRVWRCGNVGNLASIIIEKPNLGNFTPLLSCGFDMQYTPLMQFTEGKGLLVFCQLDLSGRTEDDPAGDLLFANLLKYVDNYKATARRNVAYTGDKAGKDLLDALGISAKASASQGGLLVIGPGANKVEGLDAKVKSGMNVLCLGLSAAELKTQFGSRFKAEKKSVTSELISDMSNPVLEGITNADLHWRTKLSVDALTDKATGANNALRIVKDGKGTIVLCQAAPWMFDYKTYSYLRTTFRRNVHLVSQLLDNLGADAKCELPEILAESEYRPCEVLLPAKWVGLVDRDDVGRKEKWFREDLDDSSWKPIKVPGMFDMQFPGLSDYDGLFWYRLKFASPGKMTAGDMYMDIGGVDDESWIWLNGKFLGEITTKTNPKDYWRAKRIFKITPGMLKKNGLNTLVVRVNDTYRAGGITGIPRFVTPGPWNTYYLQKVEKGDDPYRYYRW